MASFNIYVLFVIFISLLVANITSIIADNTFFTITILSLSIASLAVYPVYLSGTITRLFFLVVILSHNFGLATLYFFQDKFSDTGWTAVKDFPFTSAAFVEVFLPVVFMYHTVGIWIAVICFVLNDKIANNKYDSRIRSMNVKNVKNVKQKNYFILCLCIILLLIPIHNFMFMNMIAVTGQAHFQNPLPFKLGGIAYYTSKIIIPFLLVVLYFRSKSSIFFMLILSFYVVFSGISQMSRVQVFMIGVPLIFVHIYRREYALSIFSFCFLLVSVSFISHIRYVSFLHNLFSYHHGVSLVDFSLIITPLLGSVPFSFDELLNIGNRFGGGQDVVLATQYSISETGGLARNFSRVFLGDLTYASVSSWHLYGFQPPRGQSVGYGGLTSQMIQVTNNNILLRMFILIMLATVICFLDRMVRKIGKVFFGIPSEFILSLPVLLFLFLYASFVLFFYYVLFLVLVSVFLQFWQIADNRV